MRDSQWNAGGNNFYKGSITLLIIINKEVKIKILTEQFESVTVQSSN